MSGVAYRDGEPLDGQTFFGEQLPYFIGALLGLALMVWLPWLVLRRWVWGRWAVISVWGLFAFASVLAVANGNIRREDLSTWWAGPAGLLAILILARYDRPSAKGQSVADAD